MHKLIKNIILLAVLICLNTLGFSQEKKIKKVIGNDFTSVKGGEKYEWLPNIENLQIDTSLIKKGDTTGVHNGVEYLLFRDPIAYEKRTELYKFTKNDIVTNEEWRLFEAHVFDSTARAELAQSDTILRRVYYKGIPENYVFYRKENERESWEGPVDYKVFPLNYEVPLDLKNQNLNLYLPPIESWVDKYKVDLRKMSYDYTWKCWNGEEIWERTNIHRDSTRWATLSKSNFDIPFTLTAFYNSHPYFSKKGVIGVLGTQIKAYLHYKEQLIQKELDEQKINLKVQVSLPTANEINSLDIKYQSIENELEFPSKEMQNQWKITNRDYALFLSHIKDSIIRRVLGEYLPETFLNPTYDSDFEIKDPEDWDINYTGKARIKMDWLSEQAYSKDSNNYLISDYFQIKDDSTLLYPDDFSFGLDVSDDGVNTKIFLFEYYWTNHKRSSIMENLTWFEDKNKTSYEDDQSGYQCNDYWTCNKDLRLGWRNSLGWNSGVRSSNNFSKFTIHEIASCFPGLNCKFFTYEDAHNNEFNMTYEDYNDIAPEDDLWSQKYCNDSIWRDDVIFTYDFKSDPDALITINYDQALAYYHWKNKNLKTKDNPIYPNLLPTEDQFLRVQKGEVVLLDNVKIKYPTPQFRYTVHLFPKEK